MSKLHLLLATSCLALSPSLALAAGDMLLTANGASNAEFSQYKDAPILKTAGTYYPTPQFAPNFKELGEVGTVDKPISFTTGILTNGDTSTNFKRRPMPYVYWSGKNRATLDFDFGQEYRITKVRVALAMSSAAHGVKTLGIYTGAELLESGALPMKEITPRNGWNEFVVGNESDKIKLEFTRAEGARYITVTEVEIWGQELEDSAERAAARQPAKIFGANVKAFDFGPANAPLAPEFLAVDSKTFYAAERGYGWIPYAQGVRRQGGSTGLTQVPGLMDRDRGTAKTSLTKDDLTRDFVGVERSYTRETTQEFVVDLPNGQYQVFLTAGDLMYGSPGSRPLQVEAEGRKVIESVNYDIEFRAEALFQTAVTDGQLNLRFSDPSEGFHQGWALSGLVILPVNNATQIGEADVALQGLAARLKAQREKTVPLSFSSVVRKSDAALFELSAEQKKRGYLLFARDWMRMMYPDSIPLHREVENAAITVAAAPGEYTPATLGIYPLQGTMNGTFEMSDLVNEQQQKITKNQISMRVTGYLPDRVKEEPQTAGDYTYYVMGTSSSLKTIAKVPKILRPYRNGIEVPETTQLWLTFQVPQNAKPGVYRGSLLFKPQNLPPQTVPVTLTVYPFELLQSDRIQGAYWQGARQHPALWKKELQDMAEHGIRSVVISGFAPLELKKENGRAVPDFSRLDILMEAIKEAGLSAYVPFSTYSTRTNLGAFLQANPEIKMSLTQAYQLVVAQAQQRVREGKWPLVLFYPVDEIGNSQKHRDELKKLSPQIRAAAPDAKIYTTVNNHSAGVEYADYFDYQTVNIPVSREQEKEIVARGKHYMRYGNSYNSNPRISRTLSGFGFWQRPALAMYYYHYQLILGDPFNALDGTTRDFVLSYPSPEGPLNSIDFEAIREGNNDLRYIRTMQVWMEKAQKADKAAAMVQKGQTILDEITNSNPAYNQYDFAGVPNEKYHEWRNRMARVIISLQRELSKP